MHGEILRFAKNLQFPACWEQSSADMNAMLPSVRFCELWMQICWYFSNSDILEQASSGLFSLDEHVSSVAQLLCVVVVHFGRLVL